MNPENDHVSFDALEAETIGHLRRQLSKGETLSALCKIAGVGLTYAGAMDLNPENEATRELMKKSPELALGIMLCQAAPELAEKFCRTVLRAAAQALATDERIFGKDELLNILAGAKAAGEIASLPDEPPAKA